MPTNRQRATVERGTVPYLPRHVRLKFSEIRNAWAVLAPERVLWPDEISLEILKRCNGKSTAAEIIADLCNDYNAPPSEVEKDVLDFLQEWRDEMLIGCEA
ncbi:MAG TPA: pyrroloquinoline quinone biosynthesis peptide chaperone PqqD [Afifellaceae bacterium]|nr:pyrroloquinoline quinone biosynthesis peptide chaperone PqqD [Afifellaceae bacterium]